MTGARCGAGREKAWGEERSRCRPGRRVARSCGRAGILPTKGRLVRSPKRFEPPNSLEIGIERECRNTVNLSVSENTSGHKTRSKRGNPPKITRRHSGNPNRYQSGSQQIDTATDYGCCVMAMEARRRDRPNALKDDPTLGGWNQDQKALNPTNSL